MLVSIFAKILSMSLVGVYVIGIVLLVRLLLRKCERKYSYFLWFVVFINLCLPFSIQAPFSLVPSGVMKAAQISVGQEVAAEERELLTGNPLQGNLSDLQEQSVYISGEESVDVFLPENMGAYDEAAVGKTNENAAVGVEFGESAGTEDGRVLDNGAATGEIANAGAEADMELDNGTATGERVNAGAKDDKVADNGTATGGMANAGAEDDKVADNSMATDGMANAGVMDDKVADNGTATGEMVNAGVEDGRVLDNSTTAGIMAWEGIGAGWDIASLEKTVSTSLFRIASGIWLGGIVIVWCVSGVQILHLNRKLKNAGRGDAGREGIVCMEGIASPFLWGIFKPTIYLPMNLEETEKEYIIAHESYHKKRRDYISKAVVFAIVSIHWFNPLVWAAYALFCKDMEISCDEAVLSHSKEMINKQYAASLLKYAAKQNGFVLTPLTFGEPSVKARIHNVLRYKKGSIVVTILAICVVSLTACGLMVRTGDEEPAEGADIPGAMEKEQNGQQENDENSTSIGESSPEPDSTLAPDEGNTVGVPNERGEIILVQDGDYCQVKVLWEDLDNNGQQEYLILESEVNSSKLRLYFNEKLVYTQESPELRIMSVDQKEYLDLDNDGEKEIFISYSPRVNSRPLEEWFVLKQTDGGWEVLEQYHNEESSSGIDNAFPITVTLYKKPYELMIACEDFDKKIYYNAAKYYEEIKEDLTSSGPYTNWLGNSDSKEGDIVGGTDAWGIWDIKAGEYEGQNCLIAEHGIIGMSRWWENYGEAYVYFNYDSEGHIRILDLIFKEYGEDEAIAATTQKPTDTSVEEAPLKDTPALTHTEEDDVTKYTGTVPAYHTSHQSFSKSDGSVKCRIDWMKLSDELILEDLSFDLTMEFIEKKVLYGAILDIFYEEDEHAGTVSLLINGYKSNESEGYREATWLIQFSPLEPENYTIAAYDTQGAWFGEVKYVNGCFYLQAGAGTLPYEIQSNALQKEGRSCEQEYWRAMGVANGFMDTVREAQGIDTAISWFTVIGERNDCTIYQGLVQEEMDTPILAKVYVATKGGLIVDAWLEEQENTVTEPEQENTAEAAYYFKAGDFGDYNAAFILNGFEYRFLLDMDVENMELEVGDSTEEERYGYTITVSPVYVTDGEQKEYLGDIHGYRFYMNSEHYVGPKYADATKLCGRIMSVDEQGMSVYLGKEVERNTYTEIMNNSTEETYYEFAENVEYIMLEAEFRSVPVTYEHFMQIWESKDCNTTFYYFFEQDGKIVQIWEPYTP